MSNTLILLPARNIRAGHALHVTVPGAESWVGPMIHRVEVDEDMGVIRLFTVNGGETTRPLGAFVVVVDLLG